MSDSDGDGEKWSDLRHILEVECIGFAERLDMGCERNRGPKKTEIFYPKK